ncbi:MAG: hypothetical protein H6867_06760 [Rhodospirillales bacterium]|nr:hypothetical protein [Rhodospirillales bacterium]MCB9995250.1 hypothetical protein [Rhodospirillales bacterium]
MGLKIDAVTQACNLIAREVRDYQKNLTIHFIVHHDGQRTEALGLAAQDILVHPAAETALHFLQKPKRSEQSALLGTAVAKRNLFFGLATRDILLALCTINLDHFETLREVKHQAHHLAWHAIDAANYHSNPVNRTGAAREFIIRKRNALELAADNLQADVFSAAMSAFNRDKAGIRDIALKRGTAALHTRSLYSPEYFPYVIAMEATEYALDQIDTINISKKRKIHSALKIAHHVGMSFDEINLKSWLAFAEPAQDMAWRGFSEPEIVSAAINTSQNTFIRAIGYLIAELAKITPAPILQIRENYSPFADNDFNESLHEKVVDQIFQDVIAQGIKQNSAAPFMTMANQQNNALTEGKTLGWCASALHAAGKAYLSSDRNSDTIETVVREEFRSKREKTQWDDLKDLGKKIVRYQREGHLVTMSDVRELAQDIKALEHLQESLTKTMEDPHYQYKLAAANELANTAAHAPKGPALAAATPKAGPSIPAAGFGFTAPGLGGGQRAIPPATQQTQTETTGSNE